MTRLQAVLGALSDSWPSDGAMTETGSPDRARRSPARTDRA